MNNQFKYDTNGKPQERRITSARRLSSGKWLINGRICKFEELTKEEKEAAKALQAMHDTAFDRQDRHVALKKFKEIKKI